MYMTMYLCKLRMLVGKCLRRAAQSYLIDLCIPVSATTARSCHTFVLTLWSDNSALDFHVTDDALTNLLTYPSKRP